MEYIQTLYLCYLFLAPYRCKNTGEKPTKFLRKRSLTYEMIRQKINLKQLVLSCEVVPFKINEF